MPAWLSIWSEVQIICIWSGWCHCHPVVSCFIKIQVYQLLLVISWTVGLSTGPSETHSHIRFLLVRYYAIGVLSSCVCVHQKYVKKYGHFPLELRPKLWQIPFPFPIEQCQIMEVSWNPVLDFKVAFNISGFSVLTLLVGWQEEHPACKNWVTSCWCGYLTKAKCRWFAYGLADATATHYFLLQ